MPKTLLAKTARTVDTYCDDILAALSQGTRGILQATLHIAAMAVDYPDTFGLEIRKRLGWSKTKTSKYQSVGEAEWLHDIGDDLPPHWTTLYTLYQMGPVPVTYMVDEKVITPAKTMEQIRTSARKMVKEGKINVEAALLGDSGPKFITVEDVLSLVAKYCAQDGADLAKLRLALNTAL